MKQKQWIKPTCIVLGIILPIAIIMIFAACDISEVFKSWTVEGVNPDWRYIWLIIFKLTIYVFPPL